MSLLFYNWTSVLLYLYDNEFRDVSVTDVVFGLKLTTSNVSSICRELKHNNLIVVEHVNGRQNKITLTSKGKELAEYLYKSRNIILR